MLPKTLPSIGIFIRTTWQRSKKIKPEFHAHDLFVGHNSSEIENITLMLPGSVLQHMNGKANYVLL